MSAVCNRLARRRWFYADLGRPALSSARRTGSARRARTTIRIGADSDRGCVSWISVLRDECARRAGRG